MYEGEYSLLNRSRYPLEENKACCNAINSSCCSLCHFRGTNVRSLSHWVNEWMNDVQPGSERKSSDRQWTKVGMSHLSGNGVRVLMETGALIVLNQKAEEYNYVVMKEGEFEAVMRVRDFAGLWGIIGQRNRYP